MAASTGDHTQSFICALQIITGLPLQFDSLKLALEDDTTGCLDK